MLPYITEYTDMTLPIVACGGGSAGEGLETWPIQAGKDIAAHWFEWYPQNIGEHRVQPHHVWKQPTKDVRRCTKLHGLLS